MCAVFVGLPTITVIGVDDEPGEPLRVHVETTDGVVGCAGCGTRAWLKDHRAVTLVDLPAFGRPAILVWHERRWRCPERSCEVGTWTEQHPGIAAARAGFTDRAGRWMTAQVGQGRPVSSVADELGCDWHTLMDAVVAYGTPLADDPDRIGAVTALGLDETLFVRTGPTTPPHGGLAPLSAAVTRRTIGAIPVPDQGDIMAICRIYEIDGATLAQYDEVNAKFPDHPEGSRIHLAGVADGRLCVVEIWESAKDADEYMATGIGEAIEAAGIMEGKMTEFEIHNLTEPT